MKAQVYSILDNKTGLFTAPVLCHNNPHAMRVFTDAFRGESQYAKFPGDFSVMNIGTFNDETGEIESCKPQFVATGAELITSAGGLKSC